MRRIIRTLVGLATIALGVAGYLISTNHKYLASWVFVISGALYGIAFVLWLINKARTWFNRWYVPRAKQKVASDFIKRFTVRFDKEMHEPHCPLCLTELVPLYKDPATAFPSRSHFKCIPCDYIYQLTNEENGQPLTLQEAKLRLAPKEPEVIAEPEPLTLRTDEPQQHLTTPEPETEATPSGKTELAFNFTVLWNREATPFCPSCEGRLFPCDNITHKDTEELRCASCFSTFLLLDDNRKRISLPEAMRRLLSPTPKPRPAFKPDEIDVKILSVLYNPLNKGVRISELTNQMNLGRSRFNSHYAQLKKENFLESNYDAESKSHTVYLTDKAKEFLKQPDHKSNPAGFRPDITQEELLIAIASPSEYKYLWAISRDAYIDKELAKSNLDILEEKGFVTAHRTKDSDHHTRIRDWDDAIYNLTYNGRRYLVENNLLPDNY